MKTCAVFYFFKIFRSSASYFKQHFYFTHFYVFYVNILISQISNFYQRAMRQQYHGKQRLYAMVGRTAMITVTRKCAIVLRTHRSNVIVTSLMMVVQGGDA